MTHDQRARGALPCSWPAINSGGEPCGNCRNCTQRPAMVAALEAVEAEWREMHKNCKDRIRILAELAQKNEIELDSMSAKLRTADGEWRELAQKLAGALVRSHHRAKDFVAAINPLNGVHEMAIRDAVRRAELEVITAMVAAREKGIVHHRDEHHAGEPQWHGRAVLDAAATDPTVKEERDAAVREEALKEACGAVCIGCKYGEPIDNIVDHPLSGKLRCHGSLVCNAVRIRKLIGKDLEEE